MHASCSCVVPTYGAYNVIFMAAQEGKAQESCSGLKLDVVQGCLYVVSVC